MTSFVNKAPASTYKDVLQVSNTNSGITTSLTVVSDGEATDSCLYLATSATSISSSLNVSAGISGDTLNIAQYIELGSTQITEAGVGVLDGITAGTAAASKAVVLDAASQIDTLDILSLSITGTGLTSSAAELNVLDGVTAGSITASKAIVVDSDKSIGTFGGISGDTLSAGQYIKLGGTDITASAAEINYNDITAAGTVEASKTVTVDSNKSVGTFGGISGDTLDIAQYIELGSTQITESEVGVIDGVTAGTSAANKAVVLDVNSQIDALDILSLTITGTGLTSTATELNKLDGVTSSTAELNYVSGVTIGTARSTSAVVLDGESKIDAMDITSLKIGGTSVSSTAAELNYCDITAAGTVQASKAVVLDGSAQIDTLDITGTTHTAEIYLAGTGMTATAAELNVNDGVTAGTVLASKVVVVNSNKSIGTFGGISGDTLDIAQYIELGSTQITETEVGVLDGVTAGTSAASKAVVLDVNSQIDALDILSLTMAGTGVTSTATEINKLDGVTATTQELNVASGVTIGTVRGTSAVVVDGDKNIGTFGGITGDTITSTTFMIGANGLDTNEWAYLDGQNQAIQTTSIIQAKSIKFLSIPATDQTADGIESTLVFGESITFGQLLYQNADGEVYLSTANTTTTMPGIALALESGANAETKRVLLRGFIRDDAWNWTVGGLMYASLTGGTLTQTAPDVIGQQVQLVGTATHADRILFNPNLMLIEVA